MSDNTIKAVRALLDKKDAPIATQSIDAMHQHEMAKGMRAKRVLDMQRTNQNYYRTQTVQKPLLDHYENVDWWERDSAFDLNKYEN